MSVTQEYVPREYQRYATDRIVDSGSVGLFMEMGLGKTVAVTTAINILLHLGEIDKVLVVAPPYVAREVWAAEIHKWSHTKDLTYAYIPGPDWRERILYSAAIIDIVHYDTLSTRRVRRNGVDTVYLGLCDLFGKYGKPWPYDLVIFDESSRAKNAQSKRWGYINQIVKITPRRVILTGTPRPKSYLDLWPQVYILDRGERLGPSYWGYRTRYFESDYKGYNFTPREGAEIEINHKIADICVAMTQADYLSLPEFLINTIYVPLDNGACAAYDEMERTYIAEVITGEVVAPNAAVKSGKLLQICNGALYLQDELGNPLSEYEAIHEAKLDALTDILSDTDGPVLLAYQFKFDRDFILQRFPDACTIDSPGAVQAWNRGDIPLLIGHPASMAYGLNLQEGGHTLVWYGLPWSLELYQQMNARLHRSGQKRPVICHHLLASNTIEAAVKDRLENRKTEQDALMAYLKRRIA